MRKLRIYFYKNKYKILMTLGGIILFLLIINGLNSIVINDMKKKSKDLNYLNITNSNSSSIGNSATTITENIGFSVSDSISTGNIFQSKKEVIKEFLISCNENDIKKAYNLLSKQCKQELYNTIDEFEKNYYKPNFKNKLSFEISSWDRDTYKIDMSQDILAAGKITDDKSIKQEFITVVEEDNNYKLNINNYIGIIDINKEYEKNEIEILVKHKNVYNDYEEYTIMVNNKSKNNILLNELNDLQTIYIENNKGIKYNAAMSEIPKSVMYIKSNEIKEINIKFYRKYNLNNIIESFNLHDIILNSDNLKSSKKVNINIEL